MGDERFHELLGELGELHDKKSADYGYAEDPLANFRRSEVFGVEAWRFVLARMGDKWSRIENFALEGELKNESFEDALLDNAAYSLIALILWREAQDSIASHNDSTPGFSRDNKIPAVSDQQTCRSSDITDTGSLVYGEDSMPPFEPAHAACYEPETDNRTLLSCGCYAMNEEEERRGCSKCDGQRAP